MSDRISVQVGCKSWTSLGRVGNFIIIGISCHYEMGMKESVTITVALHIIK